MTTCGTGGWSGPLPGDPTNDVTLSATAETGGVSVSWSYPSINPNAVAHTLLYRNTSNNFATAIQIAIAAGSSYLDRVLPAAGGGPYYYWIQIVSINGTVNSVIGPASATPRLLISDVIADISNKIQLSALSTALQTDIAKISLTYNDLQTEINNRIAANTALNTALGNAQTDVDAAITLLDQEVINRQNGDSALVTQVNVIAAANSTNSAAVLDLKQAKIGYAALASTATPFDGDGSTIVYPVASYPAATYPEYAVSRTRIIDKVGVTNWNATSAGIAQPAVWLVGMPMATAVKAVQVTGPAGEIASVETALTAQKTLNDGFKAMYTAKVNVNGLVGGFGIYNDGTVVDAGFDVDNFWIGKLSTNKVKPFFIDTGVVYMDIARIRDLDVTTAKIAGNAITIPETRTVSTTYEGNNTFQLVLNTTFTMSSAGKLIVQWTGRHSYAGSASHEVFLKVNDVEISGNGGAATTDYPYLIGFATLAAGTHTVKVEWKGSSADVDLVFQRMVLMGAMR